MHPELGRDNEIVRDPEDCGSDRKPCRHRDRRDGPRPTCAGAGDSADTATETDLTG